MLHMTKSDDWEQIVKVWQVIQYKGGHAQPENADSKM